jgi:fungal STAND N-terminal Goodbye domain
MGTQPGNDVEQVSDLAQLWQSAVEDYEKKTKKSLRLAKFGSIDEVMKGTEGLSNNFKEFRHDQSKVDTVRTAFRNNLGLIQKVVDTVQVVGNVASVRLEDKASTDGSITDRLQAFPPAMPASLIFTAFGQVMQV